MNNQKYMLASGIIAAVGVAYATANHLSINTVSDKIAESKEKFSEIIDELITLSFEFLERVFNFIKKIIIECLFKLKLLLGIA